MKILIDNGHGIDTPGKRSPDGVLREYAYFICLRREDNYTGISMCFMFRTQFYTQFSRSPNLF